MSAGEETTSLCDLPLPILELIYHNVDDRARTALLRTSRWGRDCVLQLASSFTSAVHDVTLDTLARRESLARMAARVIRGEAEHGRLNSFTIDGSMVQREHNQERFTTLLADVLAAVNQQPGRYPVRNFTFKGPTPSFWIRERPEMAVPAQLAASFPVLGKLEVYNMSLTYTDLHHISACTQLHHLHFSICTLPTEPPPDSLPAALASLRKLRLYRTAPFLATGLTQLTSLGIIEWSFDPEELLQLLDGKSQLQELEYNLDTNYSRPPDLMQSIFSIGMPLNSLTMYNGVTQREFDVLLVAGTQLTHFRCFRLYLENDRSQAACSLRELGFQQPYDMSTLAYLPLHNVTRLSFDNLQLPSTSPCLEYWVNGSRNSLMPVTLPQVLTNLGRCPAWQQSGPDVEISLNCSDLARRQNLLPSSLAALSSLINKKVQLSIRGYSFLGGAYFLPIGVQEVQGMGRALGPALTQLRLASCEVHPALWPAVWTQLPGLQRLTLEDACNKEQSLIKAEDVASFCSHATRPLQLVLDRQLYDKLGGSETLERQCQVEGPQVTVSLLQATEGQPANTHLHIQAP